MRNRHESESLDSTQLNDSRNSSSGSIAPLSAQYCRVDFVKTEYSHDFVPLSDDDLAKVLLNWKQQSCFQRDEDWVFL